MKHNKGKVILEKNGLRKVYILQGVELTEDGNSILSGDGIIFDDTHGIVERVEHNESMGGQDVLIASILDFSDKWELEE